MALASRGLTVTGYTERMTSQTLHRLARTMLTLLLVTSTAACATDDQLQVQVGEEPAAKPAVRERVTEVTLQAGALPQVNLSAEILYKLLAADIAAQRGALLPAANTTLEVAKQTTDPRLAKRAVELYAAAGDLAGALKAADVWVANAPSDRNAVSTQLALRAASGNISGLSDVLAKQVRESKNKTEALARAMNVLRRMQDRSKALDVLQSTIDKSGVQGTLAAHMALADLAHGAGDDERALREAKAAIRVQPTSADAAMRMLDYGMKIDAQAAIAQARQFARDNPGARQLRLMLAGKLAENNDMQGALDELSLMSSQFPEDFDLLFIRAQLAFQAKQLSQAKQLLLQYVQVQSQRQDSVAAGATDAGAALADAYMLLSRVAEREQDFDQAITWLGLIEEPNARYGARLRQATLRADQGRVDEALTIIDATHPADQDEQLLGVLTAVQILRKAQRFDDAIDRLIKADSEVGDSVEVKYELGMLLEMQKRHDEMEKYLREVIALDPGYAHAYNALGYSLADRNERLQEAYDLIVRANQILPQDPYILDSLGWVNFRRGDNEAAKKFLWQAYRARPEAEIAAHLGEVLWVEGDQSQARQVWLEGLKLDRDNHTLKETLKRFGVEL